MSLEQIIRPFQLDNGPFRQFLPIVSIAPPNVVWELTIFGEDNAEPKLLTGTSSGSVTVARDQKSKITPTKSDVIKIENKEDPDQYVEAERYSKMDNEAGKGKQFRRTRTEIDNKNTENANAEVLRKNNYNGWTNFKELIENTVQGPGEGPWIDANGNIVYASPTAGLTSDSLGTVVTVGGDGGLSGGF